MIKKTFYNLEKVKRQRIIDSALHEFTQKQYSNATITNICRLAEIPKGSFYQYFDTKLDCLVAVLDEVVKIKMKYIDDSMKELDKNGFLKTLKKLNLNLIKMMDEYPQFFDLAKNIYGVKEILPVLYKRYSEETYDFYERLIQSGVDNNEINPYLDKKLIIIYLETVHRSFTEYMKGEFEKDPEMSIDKYMKFADVFFEMICNGIGRRYNEI